MNKSEKKLFLMRHGSAEAINFTSDDRTRKLTPDGKKEAFSVGTQIRSMETTPDFIYASDATRVRQTHEQLTTAFETNTKTGWNPDFYCCNPQQVIDHAISIDEKTQTLMLLGHNPTWSELVLHLSGTMINLLPAHCVLLTHNASSWAEALNQNNWSLKTVLKPAHI